MRAYKIGDKLIYRPDNRLVEFRGYAEYDINGAYIYFMSGYGGDAYVDIKQLDKGDK